MHIDQLNEFLATCSDALMLATVNENELPEASYAPYVEHEGSFYIFVSGLASHTANLQRSGTAGILLMHTKSKEHAHTRKRLSCQCEANAIAREDELFGTVIMLMKNRFGNLIATLESLGDFQLFQLNPIKGNFVAGFGKAYEVSFSPDGSIRHKRPD